jgi:hypothetical protein
LISTKSNPSRDIYPGFEKGIGAFFLKRALASIKGGPLGIFGQNWLLDTN